MKRILRNSSAATSPTQRERVTDPKRENSQLRMVSRAGLVQRGIAYSSVHLLRLEEEGKFPRRVYLSPARVAWIETEIDEYLARCISARG
jgi:prophage regulatory protein